ncbi:Sensor histidine kinase LiaS [Clavibacter michiganensis subsp. michiganensis]|nr:histidine kinase [Clavibacter michiganensis]OUD86177.1 Sensor histidine kinase LiaS [Clavibacter michiganensis subsp. michiganensis]
MIPTRTVHAGYAVTMALLVLLALGSGGDVGWGAWGAIAAMSALYLLLGRRALEASAAAAATEARLPPEPTALVFLALVIPAATWGVASLSSFAVVQCVLCPLVWLLLDRVRDAVIGTLVLTGSIAVGFVVGFGDLPGALPTMALSQGLSLVGTIALGLWITRIADLSRERLELLEGLRAAQAQVEELGREAGTARERERLSADIHDTVAQDLTGLVMLAQRGRRELRGGDADATGATLAELEEGARDALTQTRAIVAATAPMELTDGLGQALARLGERLSREAGIPVEVRADPGVGSVDRDAEVVLLRCAQEGLANVRRHADASAVELVLDRDGGDVVLVIRDDGRLLIVAADHPARGALGVGDDPMALADRDELLAGLATALTRDGVDGVLGTPDIVDDLALLGLLDDKVVVGSMNRGGLRGAVFEMDDRFTAYDVAGIVRDGLDFAKTLVRIALGDAGTAATLEANARAVDDAVRAGLPIMLEPFMSAWQDGRIVNDLTPDAVITSIAVASGLGSSSARTWMKLPVVDDMARVMAATTLPTLLLGGDPQGASEDTWAGWEHALDLPGVRGLVVGRTLIHPADGDVARAVDQAVDLVHGRARP